MPKPAIDSAQTGPDRFVEPPNYALTIKVKNFHPTCGYRIDLITSRIELNPKVLAKVTKDHVRTAFNYGSSALVCSSCQFREVSTTTQRVDPDETGTATMRLPKQTGLYRTFLDVSTGIAGTSSGPADVYASALSMYRVASSTLAVADHTARKNLRTYGAQLKRSDPKHATLLIGLADSQREFLDFRKAAGGDRLAEVYGDLVAAKHVAVTIPGNTMDVQSGYACSGTSSHPCSSLTSNTWAYNAERLWKRAAVRSGGDRTAVIAYMNYDAPGFSNVASSNAAVHGMEDLRGDLHTWHLDGSTGTSKVVIVADSYGTLVAGLAAGSKGSASQPTLAARDLVFTGSPGVGILVPGYGDCRPNAEFGLGIDGTGYSSRDGHCCPKKAGGSCYPKVMHTWVGVFDNDPVGATSQFGTEPDEDGFGAYQFATDPPACDAVWDCHSRYFNWDQTSLDGLARIVVGDYDHIKMQGKNPALP